MRMLASTLALALPVWPTACLNEDERTAVQEACRELAKTLPENVHLPNSPGYNLSNTYWSARQSALHPQCFVTPRSTQNVSHVMKTLTSLKAPFSVKGAGHTAFPGGSNIQDGVTIDLAHLDQVAVSPDRKTVAVGPGNRWINVSSALDPLGLAVVGGRAASVGVSGLTLGGGQSYFSGLHGWACDNVRNFQLVLSSGRVVDANASSNADLYRALRGGGGSNYGIVTRFDLASFEQGDLWTRSLVFDGGEANRTLLPRMTGLAAEGLAADPGAHAYFVQTYDSAERRWLFLTSFFHATPPAANATPAVFDGFESVPGLVLDNALVGSVSTISRLIDEPVGQRATWWDTTVAVGSVPLFEEIGEMYKDWVVRVKEAAQTRQFTPYLVYQPITDNILEKMQQNGGNALGLYPQDGPLMMVQVSARWADAELDAVIESSASELLCEIERVARENKLLRGYVYINYAGRSQEVLRTYGNNYPWLQTIAKKWDPDGLLQRLWRGYFQLR
ncbi:FAD-dependent monooxygenase CTB5 [Metarhizium brunneum]|uniref:FAD-dependent monooxygenase CTB5 n=1 Tax=Metarhizium brunneum TaxID=500148 RepID=A0A7D5YT68_9HYPO